MNEDITQLESPRCFFRQPEQASFFFFFPSREKKTALMENRCWTQIERIHPPFPSRFFSSVYIFFLRSPALQLGPRCQFPLLLSSSSLALMGLSPAQSFLFLLADLSQVLVRWFFQPRHHAAQRRLVNQPTASLSEHFVSVKQPLALPPSAGALVKTLPYGDATP